MQCPYCNHINIEGAEECDECQQPLTDLHLPTPASEVERCLLEDRVSVLNPKTPVSVPPTATVSEVLKTMIDKKIGCVLINDGGKLIGVFSEQDALKRLGVRAAECGDHPISKYMTSEPHTLAPTVKVAFAVHRMDQGSYRHLPIVNDETEGMISVRDILQYLSERMG